MAIVNDGIRSAAGLQYAAFVYVCVRGGGGVHVKQAGGQKQVLVGARQWGNVRADERAGLLKPAAFDALKEGRKR
jgi:hypothetical protein